MKTILFSPAAFNLAETSRCIEVAKALKDDFNVVFMSYGGEFENLIEEEGFKLEKIHLRLTPEQIEHFYKVDQGEKFGEMFSQNQIEQYVEAEIRVIKKYQPAAIVTGFDLIASISSRVASTTLIWLTQSTWDLKQMVKLGLGSYTDDFDLPVFRFLPECVKIWLTFKMLDVFGGVVVKPFNKVAKKYGIKQFDRIEDLWQGDYNLLAEPEGFSGKTEIPSSYHYIGPLIAKINTPVPDEIKNLSKDKPVVYFAMGSSGRTQVIKKILEGFKGQPFNVIAPVKKKLEGLNIDIPENVLVTGWLPALKASKMADLSVIHGGVGTVMTAALAGRPVVGIGMMYEQEYNIECLVRKGFAMRISRNLLTSEVLNSTIKSLLADEQSKQNAQDYQKIIEKWYNGEIIRNFFNEYIK